MAEDKNVENVTEEAVSPQAEEAAREISSPTGFRRTGTGSHSRHVWSQS